MTAVVVALCSLGAHLERRQERIALMKKFIKSKFKFKKMDDTDDTLRRPWPKTGKQNERNIETYSKKRRSSFGAGDSGKRGEGVDARLAH
jgi:hypothetical protein